MGSPRAGPVEQDAGRSRHGQCIAPSCITSANGAGLGRHAPSRRHEQGAAPRVRGPLLQLERDCGGRPRGGPHGRAQPRGTPLRPGRRHRHRERRPRRHRRRAAARAPRRGGPPLPVSLLRLRGLCGGPERTAAAGAPPRLGCRGGAAQRGCGGAARQARWRRPRRRHRQRSPRTGARSTFSPNGPTRSQRGSPNCRNAWPRGSRAPGSAASARWSRWLALLRATWASPIPALPVTSSTS